MAKTFRRCEDVHGVGARSCTEIEQEDATPANLLQPPAFKYMGTRQVSPRPARVVSPGADVRVLGAQRLGARTPPGAATRASRRRWGQPPTPRA